MGRRVHRHQLVVGGTPLTVELTGDPLHVAAQPLGVGDRPQHLVEFWVEDNDAGTRYARTFQAFGTGHELPDSAVHWGTTQRTEGLVWHLYELEGGA